MVKAEDGQAGHKNLKVWFLGKEGKYGMGAGQDGGEGGVREVAGFGQKNYDQW